MIWVALLLGVAVGIAFDRTLDWILLDPTEYRRRLESENAELKKEVSTLRAQLEALDEMTPDQKAF